MADCESSLLHPEPTVGKENPELAPSPSIRIDEKVRSVYKLVPGEERFAGFIAVDDNQREFAQVGATHGAVDLTQVHESLPAGLSMFGYFQAGAKKWVALRTLNTILAVVVPVTRKMACIECI